MTRTAICDKCLKEIPLEKEYIALVAIIETIDKGRHLTRKDEEEIAIYHKKCFNKGKKKGGI